MSDDPASSSGPKINLAERFPRMRPVKTAPVLTTMNGIGFGVYGRRDVDEETGAYVKTHCFCVVFIPLLALGAYRVVDSREGGWYFLGKEPLSKFAKGWNSLLLGLVLAGTASLSWDAHVSSPEYRARQSMARANQELQTGNPLKAAGLFRDLLEGPASVEARPGLQRALQWCLASPSVVTNEAGYILLGRLGTRINQPTPLIPQAWSNGLAKVETLRANDPEMALRLFDAVRALDPKAQDMAGRRLGLLREVVTAQPSNTNRLVELAVAYEENDQTKESVELLRPHQAHLGDSEGARILGQALLKEGLNDDAYRLLYPYVQTRLARLRGIEQSYTNAVGSAYRAAVDHLRFNKADPSWYHTYEQASKSQQAEMVEKFVQTWMQSDKRYQRALQQLKEANPIVHVTLDLGIVQLNRAQSMSDPAQRKQELEAAEKTFLAIRGVAGETDEYKLFLGQVYYWLGRASEGKTLFDQLLASRKRAYPVLMSLAETLREVGEDVQARQLLEEAYQSAPAGRPKFNAASMRATASKDVADKIAWLEKADATDAVTTIALNNARGDQALEQGRKDAAANFLRQAIAGYDRLPRSSATCNNTGLAYLSLYEVTGANQDLTKGLALLEQAVALEPGNSILVGNVTQTLISRAVMDAFHDRVRFDLIKEQPELDEFGLLYDNETERRQVVQAFQSSETLKRALTYLDRAVLLAPKTRGFYHEQLFFQRFFESASDLARLQQRVAAAQLNDAEVLRESKQTWSGSKDKEYLEKVLTRVRRYESLLASAPVEQHPGTLEYVTVSLNRARLALPLYGGSIDFQKVIDSALGSYQTHHCSATRGALSAAYCAAALEQVAAQHPELTLTQPMFRAISARHLIALLLEQDGAAAGWLRQNAHLQKALALEIEAARAFDSFREADEWALFRTTAPAEAAQTQKRVQENTLLRLADEIQFQLSPTSTHSILNQYWRRKLEGNERAAADLYAEALRMGVPLPPLPASSAQHAAAPINPTAKPSLASER